MARIVQAEAAALSGRPLSQAEMEELLSIPLGSAEDHLLRQAARRVALEKTNCSGYIWAAVGADYAPCPMNCKFCSFGEAWGVIREPICYSLEELTVRTAAFASAGARFVVLRTTEFYSIDELLEEVRQLRRQVPGDYEIVLNTGELDPTTAKVLADVGVSGVYHACRLREGIDTPFDPARRMATMEAVHGSPLKLISLVEPIGPEHTNKEIAANFLRLLACEPEISGAMARIPVLGTPLGDAGQLSEHRLAQIIAVLRLSGGAAVQDICVHPASPEALKSGANVVVVETGAIPRDTGSTGGVWQDFGMAQARALLEGSGYTVRQTP